MNRIKFMKIYELLEIIEEKPAMYMGKKSITCLDVFIHGCLMALEFNGIEKENPPFGHFTNWVARKYRHKYPLGQPTTGWSNIILKRTKDETKAVDEFYKLLKVFKKRIPVEKKQVALNSEHKPTGFSRFFMNGKELPVPIPKMMKIVQYIPDKGFYIYYVEQDGKRSSDQYFETEQAAMEKAYKEFGVKEEEWVSV